MPNPNLLITGTPAVGKSTLAVKLARKLRFEWINVSQIAKDNDFITEYDRHGCGILDEDKVIDYLEDKVSEGGKIVEYHDCSFFPERWFNMVIVLRTDNQILYDRLTERNYSDKKRKHNMEYEIFQAAVEDANDSYKKEIIHVLYNNTKSDLRNNLQIAINLVKQWKNKA